MIHVYQLVLALAFIYIATTLDSSETGVISPDGKNIVIGMTGALTAIALTATLTYYMDTRERGVCVCSGL